MQRTVRPEVKDVAELPGVMVVGMLPNTYQYKADWGNQMGNLPAREGDATTCRRCGHLRGGVGLRHNDWCWRGADHGLRGSRS